ncbi:MAG: pilus assembly protein PilM [Phycisphaerales bacterium]|nr:pilus assembly protein PilM [Phycisphaerales bacterium]
MIRLTRAQLQPIGIDIGQDSIKMMQLETTGNTLSVVAAARQSFPPEVRDHSELRMPLAVEMIRQMRRQNDFKGNKAVLALPRPILHAKNLRLPPMPPADLVAAVQFESRNIFPFDSDQARIHVLPAGDVRQGADLKQEVIVLAARHDQISEFLEQVHHCGLQIVSLDAEPLALYRTIDRFIRRREDEQEVHVLVDVGRQRTNVLIGKGREINFIKPMDIGGQQLHDAIARKLGISPDEAEPLRRRQAECVDAAASRDSVRQAVIDATRPAMEEISREISMCLRYYSVTFRGHRPAKVRLTGGESCDGLLQGVLSTALTIPVEIGRPLYSVDTRHMRPADRRGTMCEWTLAFGLALRHTSGSFAPRDGTPRDPNAPRPDLAVASAEVVDIGRELQAVSPDAPREPSAAQRRTGTPVTVGGLNASTLMESHHA